MNKKPKHPRVTRRDLMILAKAVDQSLADMEARLRAEILSERRPVYGEAPSITWSNEPPEMP